MKTQLTEQQQFKLQEFLEFAKMDMHPIVPEFIYRQYTDTFMVLDVRYTKPNQPAGTIAQITLELDTIFENDILVSREMFKKVFQDSLPPTE